MCTSTWRRRGTRWRSPTEAARGPAGAGLEPGSPLERLIAAGIVERAEEGGGVGGLDPYPALPAGQPTASEVLAGMRRRRAGDLPDSSALVKLALTEPESAGLSGGWLSGPEPLVSSALYRAEVPRAVWCAEPGALPRSYRLLKRIARVALTADVLDNSATLPPQALGAAHAVHLASALALKGDLTAFVAYDECLLAAAASAGLPVASPG